MCTGSGKNKKALVKPLDEKNWRLPKDDQSYVLQDWLQRLVVKETYGEAVTSLKTLLNVTTSVRSAERINSEMAQAFATFEPVEDFDTQPDAELLVVTADGKGVPMRQSLNQRKHEQYGTKLYESQNTTGVEKTKKRRTAGANKSVKQSAYVGARLQQLRLCGRPTMFSMSCSGLKVKRIVRVRFTNDCRWR